MPEKIGPEVLSVETDGSKKLDTVPQRVVPKLVSPSTALRANGERSRTISRFTAWRFFLAMAFAGTGAYGALHSPESAYADDCIRNVSIENPLDRDLDISLIHGSSRGRLDSGIARARGHLDLRGDSSSNFTIGGRRAFRDLLTTPQAPGKEFVVEAVCSGTALVRASEDMFTRPAATPLRVIPRTTSVSGEASSDSDSGSGSGSGSGAGASVSLDNIGNVSITLDGSFIDRVREFTTPTPTPSPTATSTRTPLPEGGVATATPTRIGVAGPGGGVTGVRDGEPITVRQDWWQWGWDKFLLALFILGAAAIISGTGRERFERYREVVRERDERSRREEEERRRRREDRGEGGQGGGGGDGGGGDGGGGPTPTDEERIRLERESMTHKTKAENLEKQNERQQKDLAEAAQREAALRRQLEEKEKASRTETEEKTKGGPAERRVTETVRTTRKPGEEVTEVKQEEVVKEKKRRGSR